MLVLSIVINRIYMFIRVATKVPQISPTYLKYSHIVNNTCAYILTYIQSFMRLYVIINKYLTIDLNLIMKLLRLLFIH